MHAVRYCTLCPEGRRAHQRAGMNGAGVHALAGTSDERLAAGFRRSDCVRLITQCLQGLGYNGAASRLEEDSGILLLAQPVSRFRQGVLEEQLVEAAPAGSQRGKHGRDLRVALLLIQDLMDKPLEISRTLSILNLMFFSSQS